MTRSPRTVAAVAARLHQLPPQRQAPALDACCDVLSYFESPLLRTIRPRPLRASLPAGTYDLERFVDMVLKQTKAS